MNESNPDITPSADQQITENGIIEQAPQVQGEAVEGAKVVLEDTVEVTPVEEPASSREKVVGGYSNIRTHVPGTMYQPGMPIRIDTPTNPQTGDPQVPKLD